MFEHKDFSFDVDGSMLERLMDDNTFTIIDAVSALKGTLLQQTLNTLVNRLYDPQNESVEQRAFMTAGAVALQAFDGSSLGLATRRRVLDKICTFSGKCGDDNPLTQDLKTLQSGVQTARGKYTELVQHTEYTEFYIQRRLSPRPPLGDAVRSGMFATAYVLDTAYEQYVNERAMQELGVPVGGDWDEAAARLISGSM